MRSQRPSILVDYSTASTGLGLTSSWTIYDNAGITYDQDYYTYDGAIGEQFGNRTDIVPKLEVVY